MIEPRTVMGSEPLSPKRAMEMLDLLNRLYTQQPTAGDRTDVEAEFRRVAPSMMVELLSYVLPGAVPHQQTEQMREKKAAHAKALRRGLSSKVAPPAEKEQAARSTVSHRRELTPSSPFRRMDIEDVLSDADVEELQETLMHFDLRTLGIVFDELLEDEPIIEAPVEFPGND